MQSYWLHLVLIFPYTIVSLLVHSQPYSRSFLNVCHSLPLIRQVRDQHIEFRDPAEDVMGSPMDVGFEARLDVSDEDAGLLRVYPPEPM